MTRDTILVLAVFVLGSVTVYGQVKRITDKDAKKDPMAEMQMPASKETVQALRQLTTKMELRFSVACSPMPDPKPNELFFAYAEYKSAPLSVSYVEDGAKPFWAVSGPTQEAAARALLWALQSRKPIQPSHKPKASKEKLMCPPEIRGGYSYEGN